ncbi:MAG: hypothetical protein HZA91_03210 [Verrucomicrobia bacterium]|nr:hypothetical protein [Verrucomicrobiota bacterium]
MDRTDWDYIKGAFSLTPKERAVVIVAAAVLAVGAAVKYWRDSHAQPEPLPAQQQQTAAEAKSN